MPALLTILLGGALSGAACSGGDGSGLPDQAPPGDEPFAAIFSEIQDAVLSPTCATVGCHQGANAPQGLRLDAANSFALLVNVASSQVPSVMRVAPGDPDDSYLVQKLEGTAAVGEQMPLNRQALPQSDIDVIRQWVAEGASDDRIQSANPIRVTSVSPLPGSRLDHAPSEVIVMFDREPDASTLHALTFIVERSGGDGSFDDGNDVQLDADAIITRSTVPMSATYAISHAGLVPDTYRVRLNGADAWVILDLDANALDGEFSGAFPSGDGAAGGTFEARFTLVGPDGDIADAGEAGAPQ